MLLALDIDGTIATNGNWYARWLAKESCLAIAEDQLIRIEYGVDFWQLPEVRALSHERRADLRAHSHAHHKDLDHLVNEIPIPGACEALQWLLAKNDAHIIYTTCRPSTSRQLTQEWLARYGFPSPEQVFTCERYHTKFIHAQRIADPKDPVILIDDQIEKMVPAFRVLIKHERPIALSLIKRIIFVQIGQSEPPTFPPVPFPVLALPSWQRADVMRTFTTERIVGTRDRAS